MEDFRFYQDLKMVVWERNFFSVSAENREEALEFVRKLSKRELTRDEENSIDFYENETLYDTAFTMTVEDNAGAPTEEYYDRETDEMLFDNAPAD